MTRTWCLCGAAVLGVMVAGGQAGAQERVALTTSPQQKAESPRRAPLMRVPMEAQVIKSAPYSADVVIESVQTLADGNRISRKSTGRVYRDSQGRTRREDDREPGVVAGISVSDPVANVSFSLDPNSKTAWKTSFRTAGVIASGVPLPRVVKPSDPAEVERNKIVTAGVVAGEVRMRSSAPAVVAMGTPEHYDEKTEKLAARNIEGVMAEGTRITRTIPAGAIGNEQPIAIVTEEWRSPELQVLVMTRTQDPRTGENTYRLLNINRGEPNQSWFEVPADYTVRETGINKLEATRKEQ